MSGRSRSRPRWRNDHSGDRGTATLWAVGAIAALCLLAVAVLAYGSAVQTRHRVVAAADLAALAGAAYVPDGETAACARARWVASGMRVVVTSCRISNWDALVQVRAGLPAGLGLFGSITAHSRAGPGPRQAAGPR
jgi:secretion/DNA translocation related TadE-like protein